MNKGCLFSLGGVLFLATIGLIYYFSQQRESNDEKIELEKPKVEDVIEKTVATGSINPRQEVEVKSQVSGVVDQIYVEEGSMVTKGQRLAKIKLIPSEVNVNSARSNVELAKIQHDESRRELVRQKKIFSNNLDVENAKHNYENAKDREQRQSQLFDEGVISKQDYDQFQLDLKLAETNYENAKISSSNSLSQYEADERIKKQELESSINNLQLLREGVTKNSRQVSNIITSTLEGMILDIPVKEGSSVVERNNFNEGTSIATIANMSDLIFEGMVDEADVGKLKTGMKLKLTIGALPNQEFEAILEHISPKGIEEDGAVKFEVRASIQQQGGIFLRAGYSANGEIILNKKENVLTINERDVIYQSDSTFVEIKNRDNEFDKVLVKLGISDGILVEVVEGLDSTQEIKKQVVIDEEDN